MTAFKLSICIPTYNFGQFIGQTLESILPQVTSEVEIVVLDGGSKDNTPEVVKRFVDACPNLKYFRFEKKGGIDRDMAKSVDLATGEYCWLFSSDDIMRPGAIKRVFDLIASGLDIYLCKHTICDINMRIISEHPVLETGKEVVFNLANEEERRRYCRLAATTEAFFSFMSAIIMKRSKWDAVKFNEKFAGSCWAHVARLFEIIPGGLTVHYVPEILLDKRGDNDSFIDQGVVKRYRIALDGLPDISDYFFGEGSFESWHIRRVLRREFTLKVFLYAKVLCMLKPDVEDKKLLDRLVYKTYKGISSACEFRYLIYWYFPAGLLNAVWAIKRKFKQIFRGQN